MPRSDDRVAAVCEPESVLPYHRRFYLDTAQGLIHLATQPQQSQRVAQREKSLDTVAIASVVDAVDRLVNYSLRYRRDSASVLTWRSYSSRKASRILLELVKLPQPDKDWLATVVECWNGVLLEDGLIRFPDHRECPVLREFLHYASLPTLVASACIHPPSAHYLNQSDTI